MLYKIICNGCQSEMKEIDADSAEIALRQARLEYSSCKPDFKLEAVAVNEKESDKCSG